MRVWLLNSSLELGMFFRRTKRPSTKALHNAFNIGLNLGTNYKAGLRQGIDLRVRSYKGYRNV